MRQAVICILASALLMFGPEVSAQTCPYGYMPLGGQQAGWHGCAPISAPNQNPPDPGPEWATRWGAIAVTDGAFGASSGQHSKRLAKKAAIDQCKRSGGKRCSVKMYFYNQCAALAWGDTSYVASRTSLVKEAESTALQDCNADTQNCRIFYSSCSYAERLR